MKKIKVFTQQLDLFGNDNTPQNDGHSEREDVLPQGRGGDTQNGSDEPATIHRKGTIRADGIRTAADSSREDEGSGGASSRDVETVGSLSNERGLIDQQWDGVYRSNGRIEAARSSDVELVNFHRTEDERQQRATFDKQEAVGNNIAALQLLVKLRTESRLATQSEQVTLSKYVGFGGLSEILLDPKESVLWTASKATKLQESFKEIHSLIEQLDSDGSALDKARASVLNAHYTQYHVINPIQQALIDTGFSGGRILEPSAGIGNFLSALPIDVSQQSDVTAIEIEPITGTILSYLYPTANIKVCGFEDAPLPDNHFDLIISNVPFGDYSGGTCFRLHGSKHEKNVHPFDWKNKGGRDHWVDE
ncbi:MAG: hypothetical protein ORN54_06250, partial [Cyclobacteriaceae bacterium]|nr:hypothetical protein [Cyclobacteriaceae bacterium]